MYCIYNAFGASKNKHFLTRNNQNYDSGHLAAIQLLQSFLFEELFLFSKWQLIRYFKYFYKSDFFGQ